MLSIEYKIDLDSIANTQKTLRGKMSRTKRHRDTAYWLLEKEAREHPEMMPDPPYVVTFTRFAPKKMDAADNFRHAFKATRDGVAIFLKMDDEDSRISWEYNQVQKSKAELGLVIRGQSVVRIEIDHRKSQQESLEERFLALEEKIATIQSDIVELFRIVYGESGD